MCSVAYVSALLGLFALHDPCIGHYGSQVVLLSEEPGSLTIRSSHSLSAIGRTCSRHSAAQVRNPFTIRAELRQDEGHLPQRSTDRAANQDAWATSAAPGALGSFS